MSDAQRVIDDIDALVEEQMRGGEPETGHDFDDPDFPECRCGLDWHGLSTSICPASDTEGPLQLPGLTFGRWPEMPGESGLVFVDEVHQWPREGVEETWSALAQAARQMSQQFAESWARLVESILWNCHPLGRPERFNLDQWVADHDWEAAVHEEPELPTMPKLPMPTAQPPMWAIDATRSRRGRQ